MSCDCEFDPDPDDPDEDTLATSWHYRRSCLHCGGVWFGLHCRHDGRQNPCPHCRATPEPVLMAHGVPIFYGACEGGPWNAKHLAHPELTTEVPMESHSKKIVVGIRPGTPGYIFGLYTFDQGRKLWVWSDPPIRSGAKKT